MPIITGGFTFKKGQVLNDNAQFMAIVESSGMSTPFDSAPGKSTFTNKEAKKVKLKPAKKTKK